MFSDEELRNKHSADDCCRIGADEHERHGCPSCSALELSSHLERLSLGGEERVGSARLPVGERLNHPSDPSERVRLVS